ncbi:MAG TPA: alpha/beta hydrolase [Bryobacteraceae bacterium]|nr:alpha/beta hydrolase [Bryobacteraceae bacterium]
MTATETGFKYRFEAAQDTSAPTLLLLHGTGGDENDLLPLGRMLAPRAALLSPRGQVLENGMPRFFRRIAEGVFDQKDLAERTSDLARFIETMGASHNVTASSLIAVGFSNGANIAASLLLRFPDQLAGAILMRAMLPFIPEQTPNLSGRPILLLSGKQDPIVPLDQPPALANLFRSAGADVTLEWAAAGHGLTQAEVSKAQSWLHQHLFS